MTVTAYAADSAGAPVRPRKLDRPPLRPLEVDVAVTHCGICHTDVDIIDDTYGISRYPAVAGHEAVGVVAAVGDAVDTTELAVGQRVGVGAIAGSCFSCEYCLDGQHQYCPHRDDTVVRGDGGGFADRVRAGDWRHVPVIPDAIPSEAAGPLLCAGSTVFAPLERNVVRPTDRVAVVGIGGLGHLAVKFLAAWGCHVTAVSRSEDKRADALRHGAHDYIAAGDGSTLPTGAFDFILSTATAALPWDAYLTALRPQGTLSVVGLYPGEFTFSPISLLMGERRIAGGLVGSAGTTRRMLDFAARHDIRPEVQVYPVARIDEALESVRQGTARYRAVLEF